MTAPKKTLLLLETRMSGHRPAYLRRITQMALRNNMQVVIAMPGSCFKHSAIKSLLESEDNNSVISIHCNQTINNEQSKNPLNMLRREYQCTRFYEEALYKAKQERQIDSVIIATFDDAALVTSLLSLKFGGTPWLGIVMRQRFHFSDEGLVGPPSSKQLILKRYFFVRLLNKIKLHSKILTIDESLVRHIASRYPELKGRVAYIPDPVDDRGQITNSNLRSKLGIPEDAFVILAYGFLRTKKGVPLLLNILHELPGNVHAVLAGTQAPEIKACINSDQHKGLLEAKRVHQIDRYIDVSEDPDLFSLADSVWLAYENYFQMSAVMVQAAQYKRPTIATKNGHVGFLTKKYQTGLLVDTTDDSELRSAVIKLLNNEFSPSPKNHDAFAKAYSLATFEDTLLDSINSICFEQG